jgi:hypothetical protein
MIPAQFNPTGRGVDGNVPARAIMAFKTFYRFHVPRALPCDRFPIGTYKDEKTESNPPSRIFSTTCGAAVM